MPLPASSPSNKRVVVPEFPQFKSVDGSVKLPPRISVVCPSSNILIPQCTKQSRVETTSFPSDKLEICDSPFDIAAKIRALCDNDLSPGNVNVPLIDILF